MPWTPRLNILPASQFRLNLINFLQANMDDALEWAAGQCGLDDPPPSPTGYHTSLAVRQSRPVVIVLNDGSDPEDDDDGNRLEAKRLRVEVERTAGDSDQLQTVLEPYTLAIMSMVLEMDEGADWFAGISEADRGDLVVSVGQERFSGRTYETEKTFLQVGSVVVTLAYTQTRKGV